MSAILEKWWARYKNVAAVRGLLRWTGWWEAVVSLALGAGTLTWARFVGLPAPTQFAVALVVGVAILAIFAIAAHLYYAVPHGMRLRPVDARGVVWINPSSRNKFRVAVTIGSIAFAAITGYGVFGIVQSAHPAPSGKVADAKTLFVDCELVAAPVVIGTGKSINILNLPPDGGFSGLLPIHATGAPVTMYLGASKKGGHIPVCRLLNDNPAPFFNLTIPLRVTLREVLRGNRLSTPGGTVVSSSSGGGVTLSGKDMVSLDETIHLDRVGREADVKFYIQNFSDNFLQVKFPEQISGDGPINLKLGNGVNPLIVSPREMQPEQWVRDLSLDQKWTEITSQTGRRFGMFLGLMPGESIPPPHLVRVEFKPPAKIDAITPDQNSAVDFSWKQISPAEVELRFSGPTLPPGRLVYIPTYTVGDKEIAIVSVKRLKR